MRDRHTGEVTRSFEAGFGHGLDLTFFRPGPGCLVRWIEAAWTRRPEGWTEHRVRIR